MRTRVTRPGASSGEVIRRTLPERDSRPAGTLRWAARATVTRGKRATPRTARRITHAPPTPLIGERQCRGSRWRRPPTTARATVRWVARCARRARRVFDQLARLAAAELSVARLEFVGDQVLDDARSNVSPRSSQQRLKMVTKSLVGRRLGATLATRRRNDSSSSSSGLRLVAKRSASQRASRAGRSGGPMIDAAFEGTIQRFRISDGEDR